MNRQQIKKMVLLFSLAAFVVSGVGCAALKKKFTRKKKKRASDEIQPVLNPIDYPKTMESPEKSYAYHFSLRKVWYKNLIQAIDADDSDKRINSYFERQLIQLEEMSELLTGEKSEELAGIVRRLERVRKELDRPAPMRQMGVLKRRLISIDRDIRNNLDVESVRSYFIN